MAARRRRAKDDRRDDSAGPPARWQVPGRRAARLRRHGRGAPRSRPAARSGRRDQDAPHRPGPGRDLPDAVPPGGAERRLAEPPGDRRRLRHRRGDARRPARRCRSSSWSSSTGGPSRRCSPPRAGSMPRRALEIMRRHLRGAGVQPPARHHPPGHQARQRDAHPDRPGQGDGLRHRPGAGQRRHHDDADQRGDRHGAVPLARSRRAARRSTPAPTCTPPAACSSSCSAGTRRSSATARSAWRTSTSGRTPPTPSDINPDVTPAVDAIVLKALAKNPLNRYQSAGEMRADLLRAAAGRPVLATPVMREDETARDGPGRRRAATRPAGAAADPADPGPGRRPAPAQGLRLADRHASPRSACSRWSPWSPACCWSQPATRT